MLETSFHIQKLRDEETRMLIWLPAYGRMAKIGFDPNATNSGYGATAHRNFSRKQRNSYGIYVTGTAKRQWNGGNQA